MNTKTVYARKAEKYDRYRWDYAPAAIERIVNIAQISRQSTLADIGAGTGILTKHFAEKVRWIYAVEPNFEMRQLLTKVLGKMPSISVLDGSAEDTKLPKNSVDVITVAQAIHWFDPEPTRQEIQRILKTGGWLALLRNYGTDQVKVKAISSLLTAPYGADDTIVNARPAGKPPSFYFGHGDFQKFTFPFSFDQSWAEFSGSLTTVSYMPDEDHPLFKKLEAQAREIFTQYSQDGSWLVEGETELIIGQLTR